MPLDPDIPLVPEDHNNMDEAELKTFAMLATLVNNKKKCQFYTNQLGLCLKRVDEIKEAHRAALQQNDTLPELPKLLQEDIAKFCAKLQPYASIPVDVFAHSDDCWLSAIAPVFERKVNFYPQKLPAPELMELFGESPVTKSLSIATGKEDLSDLNADKALLTEEEQEKLAKDIDGLSDDYKVMILGIIAADENVEVHADDEDIYFDLTNAKPCTFHRLKEAIATLLEGERLRGKFANV
ncbi:unnamed protein product [Strongylus vulgaris]|uniref:NET domain-containing protein n=1 Tax=Strongylus vulgaris TaxID=40348 RepID=A0A3P7K0N7_STRVU|nr:unnamed protein product [Strongylus vulgaris]